MLEVEATNVTAPSTWRFVEIVRYPDDLSENVRLVGRTAAFLVDIRRLRDLGQRQSADVSEITVRDHGQVGDGATDEGL